MKVKLIQHTPNPEQLIATSAKLCYANPDDIDDLMSKQTPEITEKFVNMLMSIGHQSPIEHVSFTFAIEGVSRSLTHQLVRHRHASYSQQSQRYVKLDQFEYVIPPSIEKDTYLKDIYIKQMCSAQNTYDIIVYKLKSKYILEDGIKESVAEKKAIEDARYVFPNACDSKIIVTMNARSLFNFFSHRCCSRAQWEIRQLAWEMFKLVMNVSPNLFKHAGPSCTKGKCSEGKMSCGNKISIDYKQSIDVNKDGISDNHQLTVIQDNNYIIKSKHLYEYKNNSIKLSHEEGDVNVK